MRRPTRTLLHLHSLEHHRIDRPLPPLSETQEEQTACHETHDGQRGVHPHQIWVLRHGTQRDADCGRDADGQPEQGGYEGAETVKY